MIPSLFIAHGAPLLAIEDNDYTRFISRLGMELPRPKAVILFSAHWTARPQQVSEVSEYDTIYDFGGFPDELYQIRYPAKGAADVVRDIESLFIKEGILYAVDRERGLDHGAWVVLRLLYPSANIPIVAMSVDPRVSPSEQYKIGKTLEKLRAKDVLIIGSGGTVHNLRAVKWGQTTPDDWAVDFDKWLETKLETWNLDSLFDYARTAPSAELAVPPYGNEHFIPLFYAMGAADTARTAKLLHRSYQYGNLSHSIWQFG